MITRGNNALKLDRPLLAWKVASKGDLDCFLRQFESSTTAIMLSSQCHVGSLHSNNSACDLEVVTGLSASPTFLLQQPNQHRALTLNSCAGVLADSLALFMRHNANQATRLPYSSPIPVFRKECVPPPR